MNEKPLVSILMTAYNREKYIAEAIESVIASTYQNWELIVVDDCSKDKTVEIAKSFEAKDNRIKVYINEKNLGDYPNRNKAASYAKGEYLKYVDADDLIYPHGLEILIYHMEKFPNAGYGICSLPQDDDRIYPFELTPHEAYYRHYFTKKWIFHKAPLSSIINKISFFEIGGFTGKQYLGDFEMWNLLSSKFNIALLPGDAVWHRTHDEQQNTNNITKPEIPFKYMVLEKSLLENENCPLSQNEKQLAVKKCLKRQARYILRYLKSNGIQTALNLQKMSNLSKLEVLKYAFFH
jgi:glycosyltransferase involved in cell wall biosynthesis